MFKQEEPIKDHKPEDHKEEDEGDDQDEDVQKEVVGDWAIVNLPEMPVVTGEEQQQEVAKFRSKIYRFRAEWKERGVGELRFLKHKKSGLIRILTRAEKTLKCVMNHYVKQQEKIIGSLQVLKTSNNAWTWAAYDISDQTPLVQKFAAKFTSKQDFQRFKVVFEESNQHNTKILNAKNEEKHEKKPQNEDKPAEKTEDKKQ